MAAPGEADCVVEGIGMATDMGTAIAPARCIGFLTCAVFVAEESGGLPERGARTASHFRSEGRKQNRGA